MVNVGLRAYLWAQKSEDAKRTREFWSLHDITYTGFRGFCEFIKDDGFPELYMPSRPSATTPPPAQLLPTAPSGTSLGTEPHPHPHDQQETTLESDQLSMRSSHSSVSQLSSLHPLHSTTATPTTNTFATAKHFFDLDTHPVGVVRFAHSGSDYLAMGMVNGMVKVGMLGSNDTGGSIKDHQGVIKEFRGHNGAVTDIDWSSDNLLLLTSGADGTVVVWNVESGQAVRALSLGKENPVHCCRFHPVNTNLYIVASANGTIAVQNCSTGMTAAKVETQHTPGHNERPLAMAVTPHMLVVGDARGYLHMWHAEIRDGQLQPLVLVCRTPPPRGTTGEITSLQFINFAKATAGPTLLSANMDGSVCMWDMDTWTGKPRIKSHCKLYRAESQLHARINTMVMPTEPQYMVVNAQNNTIEVFDVSMGLKKGAKLVARLQAHSATIMDVSWSTGAPLLASSDSMGTVIVWEVQGTHMV